MPPKTTQRSLAEQREQLDRVIAAKVPKLTSSRRWTKPAAAPKSTHSSRP
jgi:hypothetical protein